MRSLKINILLMLFVLSTVSLAQNYRLEQQVIGSAGSYNNTGTITISSTVGETVVNTLNPNNTAVMLTQGFQQSFIGDTISAVLSTFGSTCIGRNDGFAQLDSIKGCEPPYTILWSNGDVGTFANNLAVGAYTVDITSNDGCTQQFAFSINYIKNEPCVLKFYSGITPNNDGLNDKWEIDNIELFQDNQVDIYNRLGNRVWEGSNYDNVNTVWKGENLSGNELPSDTYFYVFESGSTIEKGWIELTR